MDTLALASVGKYLLIVVKTSFQYLIPVASSSETTGKRLRRVRAKQGPVPHQRTHEVGRDVAQGRAATKLAGAMPAIPALGRCGLEGWEFKVVFCYIVDVKSSTNRKRGTTSEIDCVTLGRTGLCLINTLVFRMSPRAAVRLRRPTEVG